MFRKVVLEPLMSTVGNNTSAGYPAEDVAWFTRIQNDLEHIKLEMVTKTDLRTMLDNKQDRNVSEDRWRRYDHDLDEIKRELGNKIDRREERIQRGWDNDRIQQVRNYPAEQRAMRYDSNVSMQTIFLLVTALAALAAIFGFHI